MAHSLTPSELRKMTVEDLRREITEHTAILGKTKIAVQLNKEKDTAKVHKTRRLLARAKTVLAEKTKKPAAQNAKEELKNEKPSRTVRSPKK